MTPQDPYRATEPHAAANDHLPARTTRTTPRRSILRAVGWSAPVIGVAIAAPLAAASGETGDIINSDVETLVDSQNPSRVLTLSEAADGALGFTLTAEGTAINHFSASITVQPNSTTIYDGLSSRAAGIAVWMVNGNAATVGAPIDPGASSAPYGYTSTFAADDRIVAGETKDYTFTYALMTRDNSTLALLDSDQEFSVTLTVTVNGSTMTAAGTLTILSETTISGEG